MKFFFIPVCCTMQQICKEQNKRARRRKNKNIKWNLKCDIILNFFSCIYFWTVAVYLVRFDFASWRDVTSYIVSLNNLPVKALFQLWQESTRKLAASFFKQSQCSKVYFSEMQALAASWPSWFCDKWKRALTI